MDKTITQTCLLGQVFAPSAVTRGASARKWQIPRACERRLASGKALCKRAVRGGGAEPDGPLKAALLLLSRPVVCPTATPQTAARQAPRPQDFQARALEWGATVSPPEGQVLLLLNGPKVREKTTTGLGAAKDEQSKQSDSRFHILNLQEAHSDARLSGTSNRAWHSLAPVNHR